MEDHPSRAEEALVRKITWRVLPLLCFLFFLAFLDRMNLANAHGSLLKDLNMDEKDYALAAGIFFVGYVIFEVPSNILLVKSSPSRWIARIMISWGAISMLQVFVNDKASLIILRVLLGIAEAGFTPAAVFMFTIWFTTHERALRMAIFFSSTAFSGLFGGLMAYGILQMEGIFNLHGWQWLFLLEGFPSIVMGFLVWFILPNYPSESKWLTEQERELAMQRLEGADKANHVLRYQDIKNTLRDWRVLGCGFVYFTTVTSFYSFTFFLPALMNDFGFSSLGANLMTTPVYLFSALVSLGNAYHSDKTQERMWHVVVPGGLGVISFGMLACACALRIFAFELVACFCVSACMWSVISPIFAWLMGGLHGATSLAVGSAFVNACGNIGGFVGPYILGASIDGTGSYDYGLAAVALLLGIGMSVLVVLQRYTKEQQGYSAELHSVTEQYSIE